MKPKWRYNIKLAQKKGVSVTQEGRASLPLFMELYKETAARDRIAIHPQTYYETLFQTVAELATYAPQRAYAPFCPRLLLYVARYGEEALASIIVLHFGSFATYLYGASASQKRNVMPTYALQWQAILDAKNAGLRCYDFLVSHRTRKMSIIRWQGSISLRLALVVRLSIDTVPMTSA